MFVFLGIAAKVFSYGLEMLERYHPLRKSSKAVVLQKHRSIYDAGITRRFPSLFSSFKARLIPNVNKRRGLDFRTPNHP